MTSDTGYKAVTTLLHCGGGGSELQLGEGGQGGEDGGRPGHAVYSTLYCTVYCNALQYSTVMDYNTV